MAKEIKLPIGIVLKEPETTTLDQTQKHFLLYIPWENKYLEFVPEKYNGKKAFVRKKKRNYFFGSRKSLIV